mmetsp:Transcript_51169/g.111446  ORF Transcript_51169/g.111446 Transcript_51169/m.111446 type:complete len:198 (-) Transcript_51169:105-698(-)
MAISRGSKLCRLRLVGLGAFVWLSLETAFIPFTSGRVVHSSRRDAVLSLASPALLQAAIPGQAHAAATAPSKWAGKWNDPESPGCRREIVMSFDGTKGRLMGSESTGMNPGLTAAEMAREKRLADLKRGCARGDTQKFWEAKLSSPAKDSDELLIDLSKSGLPGPGKVVAKWDGDGILFPDGSKWTRTGSFAGGRGS